MASLSHTIQSEFRRGNVITRLVMVNAAVFLLALLVKLFLTFTIQDQPAAHHAFLSVIKWVAIPYALPELLLKPWTAITHIFLHYDIWHLFWNMVFLFWFGRIFMDILGQSKILAIYVYGGLAGASLAILAYYLFPGLPIGERAVGASAAVYAIMLTIAAIAPDYSVHLLLIGPVKIKYIVLFRFIIDLLSLADMTNMGGSIAHLGGAAFGYWFAMQDKKGNDRSQGFNRMLRAITNWGRGKNKHNLRMTYGHKRNTAREEDYNVLKKKKQEEMDAILDKISRSGYESLTKEEKEKLFRFSQD